MTRVESGIYVRYMHTDGSVTEVFTVQEVAGNEPDPLQVGKWYKQPDTDKNPEGPFDTEQAALNA